MKIIFEADVSDKQRKGHITALQSPYCEVDDTSELRRILFKSGFILSSLVFDVHTPLIPSAPLLDAFENIRSLIWNFLDTVP